MEIDKELVRQLQKQSLEEYCLFRSIPIDEFASLKFEAYKLEKTKFSKHRNAISNIFLKYVKHPKSASLDAILDLDYEISEGFREDCLRVMMDFFSSNTYNTFLINIDFLRENAQELGIDTGSDDWLFRYLNAVPFIEIYSPLLEAYAQKIPYSFPKIIISNSLNNVFENGIVPLLVNHVFTIEKSDGALPRFHLLSNDMFPNDLASTGNMIISLAEYYLGLKSSSFVIEFQNIEKSEAFPIFGTPLALGIRLFTIFHEYSHVVYSHFSKKSEIKDEVFADNLALHIFIKKFLGELRSYKLESEAGIMSFFRIYSFAFLSPLVLMNFLTVLNILLNDKSSHTHPHPSIREKYLRKTLLNYFHNRPPLQMELEKVYSLINSVFEYIYAQFNLRDGFVEENDIESLKDINLPVQFMSKKKAKLPERQQMLQQLIAMNSSQYLREKFYPLVLEYAGQEKTANDIASMLITAICKFAVDDAGSNPGIIPSARAARIIREQGPNLVDALVDDSGVADMSKRIISDSNVFNKAIELCGDVIV